MRNIKFRAWSPVYERLFYDMITLHPIDDGPLTQYTGLKDKNGKEIYEGDIIKVMNTFRAVVIYTPPSYQLKWIDKYHIRRGTAHKTIGWNAHIIYEVIGNIYENPGLLEAE